MSLHANQPVYAAGTPLTQARAAMILVHGRGATAQDILSLAGAVPGAGWAFLAPQAANFTWYPQRFLMPTALNQPWLDSALAKIGAVLAEIQAVGLPPEKVALVGFSQGACLTLEFVARHGRRYGGVAGFSGGLIGADDEPRHDSGHLAGTPVFLGCSEADAHIPAYRVTAAAERLRALGAQVTARLYPGTAHTINADEMHALAGLMQAVHPAE